MFSFGTWSKLLGSTPELIALPYFCISLFFIQKQLWEVIKIASVVTSNSVWKTSSSAFYNYNLSTLRNIEKAKSADEKFNKLKVLYGKLRQDHIELLRKVRFLFFFFFFVGKFKSDLQYWSKRRWSCNDVLSNWLKWKWTQKSFHSNLVRLEKTDFIWQLCR